jgi:hypothetical protein
MLREMFLDFVFRSLTSIETSGQDEDNEVTPSGTIQEEEGQTKEP